MNRARLFLHDLQVQPSLGWDEKLSPELLKTWRNIVNQVNNIPELKIPRCVGSRNDSYSLIACTDASKNLLGVVIYIMNDVTGEKHFLLSKYRLVDTKLQTKSVPCLELQAIVLGVETLMDLYEELSGESCLNPVKMTKFRLLTDSLVCLEWIRSANVTFGKTNKKPIFVQNRLHTISNLCTKHSIDFQFCAGSENPADVVTRCISYKQLVKTNYLTGPDDETIFGLNDGFVVTVPRPDISTTTCQTANHEESNSELSNTENVTIPFEKVSSFSKLVKIQSHVYRFINVLKSKLISKDPSKYGHLMVMSENEIHRNSYFHIIKADQIYHYREVFDYFQSSNRTLKDMPNVVSQLNVFLDKQGILRVKHKLKRWSDSKRDFPVLLAKSSKLTEMIVKDLHSKKLRHSGLYVVLAALRKEFWLPNSFSVVKRILRSCVHCRRFNNRAKKLNQSPYREFRLKPANIPFRHVFVDHAGPITVSQGDSRNKVYLLIITCLWSRAVNIKICDNLSVGSFLRSLQLHIFQHGIPERFWSDMGSSILSGCEIVKKMIDDPSVTDYFRENGIQPTTFASYPKGCNKLGGLVESVVKIVKRLLFGSIRNLVVERSDLEFLVEQIIHLANRRPVAFKESLRDNSVDEFVPSAITPENLVKGYDLISMNIIPELQDDFDDDPDWSSVDIHEHIRDSHRNLSKARNYLKNIYNEEFLKNLAYQATNESGRYKPANSDSIEVGDVVLLREQHYKPSNFPMGIIQQIVKNDIGDTTEVVLLKGNTREKVRRHVTSLIPLLSRAECANCREEEPDDRIGGQHDNQTKDPSTSVVRSTSRKAAINSRSKTKQLIDDGRI